LSQIEVQIVQSRKDLKNFLTIPWTIYQHDTRWVPPLMIERRLQLSKTNPYFRHAEACFWIAYKKGIPVGRISAQIDNLYLARHNNKSGFWGMLESVDDLEVFDALFKTAGLWLKAKGMERMLGPFNLSINQECGLLIKGFEYPPFFMMPHNFPYYAENLETLGHKKAKDLLAYFIKKDKDTVERISKILSRRFDKLQTRALDKKHLERELKSIFFIFNDAWSENWGFVPFTQDEYMHLGKSMSYIASPNLIRIAEIEGKPVGFIVLLPNLNEIIKDMDGRLFPLNWMKLLWRIRFHHFTSGRILLMGVLKKHTNSLLGAAISLALIRDVMKEVLGTSMTNIELSWILEDNLAMRNIIEGLGAKAYKTYRIFEKTIY